MSVSSAITLHIISSSIYLHIPYALTTAQENIKGKVQ